MNCHPIPARLFLLCACNGDPLLLYGTVEGQMMLWPTRHICEHPIAFARYCKKHVEEWRGARMILNHALTPQAEKWGRWLGAKFEQGVVIV